MATTFNQQQCREILKALLHAVLGKMGIVRTTPWILAVAPVTVGGFGILSLEVEQLIKHICVLLQHGPEYDSATGMLLRCTIEYNALETGYSGDPLQIPGVSYTTNNTWISNTLLQMNKYSIRISSNIPRLHEWTNNDSFIMEHLQDYGRVTTKAIINRVRMYLRVVTLSDIVTADGKFFDENLIHGKRSENSPSPSFYRYRWPKVSPPTSSERAVWHTALTYGLGITDSQLRTTIQFIKWNEESIHHAKWIFSPTEHILYERQDSKQWLVWKPLREYRRHRTRLSASIFKISTQVKSNPLPHMRVVSVRRISRASVSVTAISSPVHKESGSDNQRPPRLPQGSSKAFQYNIAMNNGIIFTDGSYSQGVSTFAWAAQPPQFRTPVTGVDYTSFAWFSDYVQGASEDQNSYRAELGGILAALLFTLEICQKENITKGSCTLICDSKGVLCAAFGTKRPTPRWSSYDLVRKIREALQASPITWRYKHIKGHQDGHQRFENLDPLVQGNVLVDHLATMKRSQPRHQVPVEANQWSINIQSLPACWRGSGYQDTRGYLSTTHD
jgi:hypothetical protein